MCGRRRPDDGPCRDRCAAGGAAGTQVASIRVYQLLTVQQNVGAASAQSILLAVLLIIALGVYALILKKSGSRFE